jgi:catechol-2,3-dioxygenase
MESKKKTNKPTDWISRSQKQIPKLAHVVYRTRKFEQMLAWYKEMFHARVQHQNPVMAFLTYDDEHHRLALLNLTILIWLSNNVILSGRIFD